MIGQILLASQNFHLVDAPLAGAQSTPAAGKPYIRCGTSHRSHSSRAQSSAGISLSLTASPPQLHHQLCSAPPGVTSAAAPSSYPTLCNASIDRAHCWAQRGGVVYCRRLSFPVTTPASDGRQCSPHAVAGAPVRAVSFLMASTAAFSLGVGDRCLVGSKRGTVRFVGDTKFAAGKWVGVELHTPGTPHTHQGHCRPHFPLPSPHTRHLSLSLSCPAPSPACRGQERWQRTGRALLRLSTQPRPLRQIVHGQAGHHPGRRRSAGIHHRLLLYDPVHLLCRSSSLPLPPAVLLSRSPLLQRPPPPLHQHQGVHRRVQIPRSRIPPLPSLPSLSLQSAAQHLHLHSGRSEARGAVQAAAQPTAAAAGTRGRPSLPCIWRYSGSPTPITRSCYRDGVCR